MSSACKQPMPDMNTKDMNLTINPHGKKMGWANHPWNFDVIWIDNCDGFTPLEE
jgi:hypothetical protein